jgi:hypothetical protein
MLNTLVKMFLKTEIITKSITTPQDPIEYIHEVLVPELCIMLIEEDRNITYEEAQKIMQESYEYGSHLFPQDSKHL